jgi:MinD-like ATPase involved in chromosome partitioning or flagellar assembly
MNGSMQVGLALGNHELEARVLALFSHPMNALKIAFRAREATEVLANIMLMQIDAVLLDEELLGLSTSFVDQLVANGVRVVHLYDRAPYDDKAVENFEIATLETSVGAQVLVRVARGITAPVVTEIEPTGRLTAVGGFGGGVGRSSLVRELAWLSGQASNSTLVVDADTYQPAMHQLLGVSRPKTIIEVTRAIERNSLVAHECVSATNAGCNLIAGLPKAARWIELRHETLDKAWRWMRRNWQHTVVDLGPVLEFGDPIGFMDRVAQRSSFPMSATEHATDFVFVLRPDPVSVTRLIRGYLETEEMFADRPISLVVIGNLSRRDAKEIFRATHKFANLPKPIALAFLPEQALRAQIAGQAMSRFMPEFGEPLIELLDEQNLSQPSIKARLAKVSNLRISA